MREPKNYTFSDRLIEFIIMAIFLFGFIVPVLATNLYEVISQIDFAQVLSAVPLQDTH